ncbi:hypothetical protein F4782DRAFT_503490 [Xylaria castorea]|nr:hypothetical protein F4782DRAFT_503490 [Xylaria castorea]
MVYFLLTNPVFCFNCAFSVRTLAPSKSLFFINMTDLSEYQSVSESDNREPAFRVYFIVLSIASITATALRLWSRAIFEPRGRQFHRVWWDDWAALAATLTFTGQVIVTILLSKNGLGRHVWTLSEQSLILVLRLVYAIYFTYPITLALSKASALFFLTRIFPSPRKTEWFNVVILTVHTLNIAWLAGFILGAIFLCNPIEKNWIPWTPGTCRQMNTLYLASAVPSVLIDLVILILPIPKIWRLQASVSRKFAIILIFVLGYSVVVASLGRLITVFKESTALETDITYYGLDIFYWTWAELSVTLFGISLPAMVHLTSHLINTYLRPSSQKL